MTKTHQSLSTKSKKGQLQHKKRSKGSFISDVNLDLTYLHFNKSLCKNNYQTFFVMLIEMKYQI